MTDPLASSGPGRLRPGETIGRFRPLRELGRGGMGVVYEAEDPELGRRVALKLVLLGDAGTAGTELLERFFREAEVLARVRHPHLVTLHEWGRSARGPFLVTELVEGRALAHDDRLEPRAAATLVRDVAGAVAALHDAGVLHRDLKPQNILLRPAAEAARERAAPKGLEQSDPSAPSRARGPLPSEASHGIGSPVLIDLGLARLQGADALTKTGTVLGTPAYMAPEVADGGRPSELDGRVDVYGLGAILFGLLAGRPPHEAASPLLTLKKVLSEAPAWPAAPRGLLAILRRAMAKQPAQRQASARELQADLDRWLRDGDPAPRALLAAAAGALAVVVAAAVVASRPRPPEPPAPPPRPAPTATAAPVPTRAAPARDPSRPAFAGPTVKALDAGEQGVPLLAFLGNDRLVVASEAPHPAPPLRILDLRRGRAHAPPDGLSIEFPIGCLAVDPVERSSEHPPAAAIGAQRRHAGLLIELLDPPIVAAPFVVNDDLRRRPDDPADGPGLSALAFSPDGRRLVGGTRAGDLVLVRAERTRHPEVLRVLPLLDDELLEVAAVAFSSDGALLAAAVCDSASVVTRLFLLDAADPVRRAPVSFPGASTSVAWEPGGRRLAVATRGCNVRLFEAGPGPSLVEVRREGASLETDALLPAAHQASVRAVAWLGPGTLASAGGDDVAVWDVHARRELDRRRVSGEPTALAVSPAGDQLAVGLRVLTSRPGQRDRWVGRVELVPVRR